MINIVFLLQKDFIRQQIDVKIQCFHVNDLKRCFSNANSLYVLLHVSVPLLSSNRKETLPRRPHIQFEIVSVKCCNVKSDIQES